MRHCRCVYCHALRPERTMIEDRQGDFFCSIICKVAFEKLMKGEK